MSGRDRRHRERAARRDTTESLEAQVLVLVNRVRRTEGRPALAALPCGDCGAPDDCTLARALEATVGQSVIRVDSLSRGLAIARALGVTFEDWREDDGIEWLDDGRVVQEVGPWPTERWCVPLPTILRDFVRAFDRGDYPHLVGSDKAGTTPGA